MLYDSYQMMLDAVEPFRAFAAGAADSLRAWSAFLPAPPLPWSAAALEGFALFGFSHTRPDFGVTHVETRGERWPVSQQVALSTPFCHLTRFRREGGESDPKVLLVAPMSGHFATLLRGALRTLLRDHQVYITDWINPRDVPREAGVFGLEAYTRHLVDFIRFLGEDCHIVAICQPTVSALAATAVLAMEGANTQPQSLTLMAGPIDVRVQPNSVNQLANEKPLSWFQNNLITSVPWKFMGRARRVYPGFLQLSAFMSMNAARHQGAFIDFWRYRAEGAHDKADAIAEFYREYFAVMDMTAEFYLETIDQVFQRCLLPKGELTFEGQKLDMRAIRKTFLLTVEGEKDDICAIGQTLAAQDLCSGLRPYMKTHHLQAGVGHYGVFNGKRWEGQIYPVVRNHIMAAR
jgi:poly(3-hydroxybutyrate) depolymerase